jgi:putative transposase
MYHITLTEEQRQTLNARTRQSGTPPSTRERLEMVRLSDAGWSVPRIARHLRRHEQTVRSWIKAFLQDGFEALTNQPRGGSTSALTPAVLVAVRHEVAKGERSWSAGQMADWIEEQFGVQRSAAQVRRKLRAARLSYKRTSRSVRHQQKPQEVADKRAQLERLQKGARRER